LREREILAMNRGKAAYPVVDGHLRHGSLLRALEMLRNESIAPARTVGAEKNVSFACYDE
ncbi:MAG: hypothetical protein WA020_01260, partial [Candidatus Acidiferrales bacterium]